MFARSDTSAYDPVHEILVRSFQTVVAHREIDSILGHVRQSLHLISTFKYHYMKEAKENIVDSNLVDGQGAHTDVEAAHNEAG